MWQATSLYARVSALSSDGMSVLRALRRGKPIVVVSGLPRSGTSMAMRMLEAGGVPILTDRVRKADSSNPHGYFELEAVKHLGKPSDLSWLDGARGKAVKIVSSLLTWLPETYDYRVIFMRRDLSEVVASQDTMLVVRGEQAGSDVERMQTLYAQHLADVERFLAKRRCFTTLYVDHRRVLEQPRDEAARIADFIGGRLDVDAMARAVDPRLYRNRG